MVHLDFGITYMGLNTDWQKMAYVLLPGEKDAPAGLKNAMKNTNALQDALTMRAARPGRPAAEVYNQTMDEMKQKGNRGADLQPSHRQPGARPGPQHRFPFRATQRHRQPLPASRCARARISRWS